MVIFSVVADKTKELNKFMDDTNQRLQNVSMVENPYNGRVIKLKDQNIKTDHYLIDMTPIYAHFYIAGLLPIMLCVIWFRVWLLVAGLILLSLGFFWSKYFIYFMLRLGLRKAGHKGNIKLLRNSDALYYLMYQVL